MSCLAEPVKGHPELVGCPYCGATQNWQDGTSKFYADESSEGDEGETEITSRCDKCKQDFYI